MELFLCLPIYDFATRNGCVTDRSEIDFLNALSISLNSFELIKLRNSVEDIFSKLFVYMPRNCAIITVSEVIVLYVQFAFL